MTGPETSAPFAGLVNFRDLGGIPTVDGHTVRTRMLYRSDALNRLTDADWPAYLRLGVRTVIDLRDDSELERYGRVRDYAGLAYHHYPVQPRDWSMEDLLPGMTSERYLADRYAEIATEGSDGVRRAVAAVAAPEAAPVVLHCFAGKDRTGVVTAVVLGLLGVAAKDIAADYAATAPGIERLRDELKASMADDVPPLPEPYVVSPIGAMELFLRELGDTASYARSIGVTDAEVAALRESYLD